MVKAITANTVVINSIKMNRRMKSYFVKKYKRIVANQGEEEATAIFKELRQAIMSYLADPNRNSWKQYADQVRMRNNGMLAKLFEYANTNPEQCLAFVKLYATGIYGDPGQEAYQSYEESLDSIDPCDDCPDVIVDWLNLVLGSVCRSIPRVIEEDLVRVKAIAKTKDHCMHNLVKGNSFKSILAYIHKWRKILRVDAINSRQLPHWKETCPSVNGPAPILEACRLPLASDYHDAKQVGGVWRSKSFDKDFREFTDLWENENFPALGEFRWLYNQLLSEGYRTVMDSQAFEDGLTDSCSFGWEMIGGTIDLVPKPGANNAWRAVCALNRILQSGLIPIWMVLTHIVEKMPRDCSFDQAKLDLQIQKSVNDLNAYTGCVDLSKATDNLPFAWGCKIIDTLIEVFPAQWDRVTRASYALAKSVSQDLVFNDRNDQFTFQWVKGQPLGAKPSFMLLAITHNCVLEALSAQAGILMSPYGVLGDDTVMFSQTVRTTYIELMQQYNVPLSLHKSYEDRMVEFAGKLYVRNCAPFYNTDMRFVYFANLFDYQRVTGVDIPWEQLPSSLRKKIEHKFGVELRMVEQAASRLKASKDEYSHWSKLFPLEDLPVDVKASKVDTLKSAKNWYNTIKVFYGSDRGTQVYPMDTLVPLSDVYVEFLTILYERSVDKMKDGNPTLMPKTGISFISGKTKSEHTVGSLSDRMVTPLKKETQQWFKDKYRPESTDVLFRTLANAIVNVMTRYSDWIVGQLATKLPEFVQEPTVESCSDNVPEVHSSVTADGEPNLRMRRTRKRTPSSERRLSPIAKWCGKLIHLIRRFATWIRPRR